MLTESTKDFKNVSVVAHRGLVVDFARENRVDYLMRGVRSSEDFEQEFALQDIICEEEGCLPSQMSRLIHVRAGADYLPLAKDFVETMLINFVNPKDPIHFLAEDGIPLSPPRGGAEAT